MIRSINCRAVKAESSLIIHLYLTVYVRILMIRTIYHEKNCRNRQGNILTIRRSFSKRSATCRSAENTNEWMILLGKETSISHLLLLVKWTETIWWYRSENKCLNRRNFSLQQLNTSHLLRQYKWSNVQIYHQQNWKIYSKRTWFWCHSSESRIFSIKLLIKSKSVSHCCWCCWGTRCILRKDIDSAWRSVKKFSSFNFSVASWRCSSRRSIISLREMWKYRQKVDLVYF